MQETPEPRNLSDFAAVSLVEKMSMLNLRKIEHRQYKKLKKFHERNRDPLLDICQQLLQVVNARQDGMAVNRSMLQSSSIDSLQVALAELSPTSNQPDNKHMMTRSYESQQ